MEEPARHSEIAVRNNPSRQQKTLLVATLLNLLFFTVVFVSQTGARRGV